MIQSIARGVICSVVILGCASPARAQAPDGAALYKRTCAQCHDTGANRAADCAAYRPCRTMTLVRALVGTALHAIENTLSMRLMRYGE